MMELDLGIDPAPPPKRRQQHVGTDGDPNEVYIRSFPDPRAARMVMQMCWGRIAFTPEEVAHRTGIRVGLAQRLCDRAVEWKWATPAPHEQRSDASKLYVGRL